MPKRKSGAQNKGRDILFATLDFEASSLAGWPIETGWMREGDAAPRSMLIRPDSSWSMDEWDAKSAAVHKIPIEALRRDGDDAAAVLLAMSHDLADCFVVSDAPAFDARWLQRLTTACGQASPLLIWSINDAIPILAKRAGVSVGAAIKRYIKNAPAGEAPHRAGGDAERLLRHLMSVCSELALSSCFAAQTRPHPTFRGNHLTEDRQVGESASSRPDVCVDRYTERNVCQDERGIKGAAAPSLSTSGERRPQQSVPNHAIGLDSNCENKWWGCCDDEACSRGVDLEMNDRHDERMPICSSALDLFGWICSSSLKIGSWR